MKRALPLLFALLLLAACVPTPEVDAVRQKNQDAMLELAHSEDTVLAVDAGENDEAAKLDYREMYGIPAHLNREFAGLSDKVHIVVDADIHVPDQPMPIVRAEPADFSQEQVYDLWQRLVGDRHMLIRDEKETKETIKRQIARCMEILNGPEKNDYEPGEIEQRLEDLQARFNDAPDAEPPKEADGTLILGEMRDDRGNVVAHRTELKAYEVGGSMSINIQNNFDLRETIPQKDGAICVSIGASMHYSTSDEAPFAQDTSGTLTVFNLNPTDPIPKEAAEYIHSTPAQIQARADALLEQMGLSDCYAVFEIKMMPEANPWKRGELTGYVYRVDCTRLVQGIPVCKWQELGFNLYYMEDMMAPDWGYEDFTIWMDDGDDVHIWLDSPIETQEVLEPFCRLQPFSEIQRIMESRLPMLLNKRASRDDVTSCTASVRRIDLGLWRIREKNTIETGLLVPVYCFYMDISYEHESYGTERDTDILIINAVNGTVIDPWNGY